MCSVSACSEVQTCFPILPHTLHHRHNLLHTGNTHTHTCKKPKTPLWNTPLLFACCTALHCCSTLQRKLFRKACHTEAEELEEDSCSACRHSQPPSQCTFYCLHVYGHAYSLLLAFSPSNPPLLSPLLWKGLKMHWPLCCLLSWLLYWVYVCLCAPLPAASKSLFPLFLTLPLFFSSFFLKICVFPLFVSSLLCLPWCRRRRRMSRTQVPNPIWDCFCTACRPMGCFPQGPGS